MKYFDKKNNRLLFFSEKRQINYWDYKWLKYLNKSKEKSFVYNPRSIVCKTTIKFLRPSDGPILEGGCGLGDYVYNLDLMNFNVIGVDNARSTIDNLKKKFPNLKIQFADVQELPFLDNFFAGYWSLGVIEHFFKGYDKILREMSRVIKKKGYLFITFPYMSPLRKFKARAHLYKVFNPKYYESNVAYKKFYQYALNTDDVIIDLEKYGFKLILLEHFGGIKGLKDEIFFLKFYIKRFLQLLYNSHKSKMIQLFKSVLDRVLSKVSAHVILLVFQKIS